MSIGSKVIIRKQTDRNTDRHTDKCKTFTYPLSRGVTNVLVNKIKIYGNDIAQSLI